MKYLITLSLMMTLAVSAHSQWWFDAGLKGSYGPTMMYDQNSMMGITNMRSVQVLPLEVASVLIMDTM